MYGAIIGDIAGSVYEFDPSMKTKVFPFFSKASEITDDTVMTVAIADAIMNNKEYGERMHYWGRKYPYESYVNRFIRWLMTDTPRPYNSFGNGSAMRVAPVGFYFSTIEKVRHEAKMSALPTHNHPEGIKGAEAVASAIFLARNGHSKQELKRYIETEFFYNLDRTVDNVRKTYRFDETCQGSVPESIIAFLEGEDYEDTIRNAVSLGGDADTQAAIAGSIAEAYFGIPEELIEKAKEYIPEDMQKVIDSFYIRKKNID